jgi:DNA-binding transcriptional ArsR family regulator
MKKASKLSTSFLSDDQLHILVDLLKTLGDVSRLKIVLLCLKGPFSVGDITNQLELSQPLVSHHLRLLKAARLVKAERQGQQIFYSLADQHISDILKGSLYEYLTQPFPCRAFTYRSISCWPCICSCNLA